MSTRLVCVSPGDSVIEAEAVEKMTEEGIGRLLVMEDDKLVSSFYLRYYHFLYKYTNSSLFIIK